VTCIGACASFLCEPLGIISQIGQTFTLLPCMDVFHGRKKCGGEKTEIKINAMTAALKVTSIYFHLSVYKFIQ
jgi:hypothetical protein